jgi:hypothetical protein
MALVLADRVQDVTTTTGTGTITLAGTPPTGFQSFAVIGNGNTTYYTIYGGNDWEVGIGTYTSIGTTLSRDTVLASSNSGSLVSFGSGDKAVFVTYPAEKSVNEDAAGNVNISVTGNAATATRATNLAAGAAGSIPYQTAANTTAFVATASGVLIGGTTPSFSTAPTLTGTNFTAIPNAALSNNSVTVGTTAISLGATSTTLAGLVSVTLTQDPTLDLQAATKQYVDTQVSAGIHFHQPVRVESPTNLNATYNNGTAGVGATLTNAGTQAALVLDGVTVSVADRVLIYTQTDQTENGIYVVTTVGSVSTNWVLTRSSDANTYVSASPDGLSEGSTVFVQQGTTGAGETYTCNTQGTITFGTTNITFAQISSAQIYSAGTGLTLSGTQFSLTNPVATTLGGTGLATFGAANRAIFSSGTTTLTAGTLPTAAGGTGHTAYTDGQLLIGRSSDGSLAQGTLTQGTGITITNGSGAITVTNSAPDQTVSLTGSGTTTITGSYPNFNIASADQYVGTVTSVGGTGTVNGITLTGTVTSTGSLTLGGALTDVNLTSQVIGVLPTANGGTNLSSFTSGGAVYATSTSALTTGTLPVASGGTGLATLTANNVLLGNGTSALQAVAPGTAGNVLISDGTTWTSAAAPASGGSIDATASGALTAGALAIINSNGTVSAVSGSFSSYTAGSEALLLNGSTINAQVSIQYDAASGRFFAGMSRSPTSNNPSVAVGTISGNTITWGTFYSPASGAGTQPQILYKDGYVYFFWVNSGTAGLYATYQWTAGTNILTLVTAQSDITPISGSGISSLCSTNVPIGDNRFVLAYRNNSDGNKGQAILCNATSGTVAFSGPTNFNVDATSNISIATISDDGGYGRAVISFTDEGNSNRPTSVVGTVAFGFAFTIGPKVTQSASSFGVTFTSTVGLGGAVFCASAKNTSTNAGYGVIGTVSNSFYSATITFGSLVNFTASTNENNLTYDSVNNRIIVTFNNASDTLFSYNIGTFLGTTLTWGTQQTFQASSGSYQRSYINPANGNVMIIYQDGNNGFASSQTPLIPTFSTNLTAINFLGVSSASYSNGQTATIKVIGGVDSNQSGLTAGLKYYARANGTLSASEGFGVTYAGLALSATKILVKG